MGLFGFLKNDAGATGEQPSAAMADNSGEIAKMALNSISDGVIVVAANGAIVMANPAAAVMTGYTSPTDLSGANYATILRLENGEGKAVADAENPLFKAIQANEAFSTRKLVLNTIQGKKIPVMITVAPTDGAGSDRIIMFHDIANELKEESEQTEFISTASHEMRTPVASIEGYLGLALNPTTATIDDRARKYIKEAHSASQHLGNLFKDLLDVTKLDDHRAKVHMVAVELPKLVEEIAAEQGRACAEKNLTYNYRQAMSTGGEIVLQQKIYASVDVDFLREILNNLIENAIKYTPEGGQVTVNVQGLERTAVINVIDTGMGIAPEDLNHVFQKFYRADNSQTRTIGGTGLGLYIVKGRTEAMGGKVFARSQFGSGSTFSVELPRLSSQEYATMRAQQEQAAAMGQAAVAGA